MILNAQKYDVKIYSVNQGLPVNQVFDVEFDEDGYIWFATAYGMVRSDGSNFESFDKSSGLKDDFVNDLLITSDKTLWLATTGGGVGYFENDGVVYPEALKELYEYQVYFIAEAPNKELWIGTNANKLFKWNTQSESLDTVAINFELNLERIWEIEFTDDGNVWIGGQGGVIIMTPSGEELKSYRYLDRYDNYTAYEIYQAQNGEKWVSTNKGVQIIYPDLSADLITEVDGIEIGSVFSITEDEKNRKWIGRRRAGILVLDESSHFEITKKNGLSGNLIYRFVKDDDGTLWVTTNGNGVTVFKNTIFQIYDDDSAYGSNEVYGSLKSKDGSLWFGNESAITKHVNGTFVKYEIPKEFTTAEIWDIEELPNGNKLLLSPGNPMLEFDGSTFKEFIFNEPMPDRYINDIFIDDNGDILLGGEFGVLRYNGLSFSSTSLSDEYWETYVHGITKDSKGNYWFGTDVGVVLFDGESSIRYGEDSGIKGKSVYEIIEDAKGNIWFGTNKGISVNKKSSETGVPDEIFSFKTDEMYLSETIFLQYDNNGGLWQGTNGGLNYYDLNDYEATGNFNSYHYPLQEFGKGIEFNGGASILDDSGKLWFGTANHGVIAIEGASAEKMKAESPEVFIRDVFANGNSLLQKLDKTSSEANKEALDHNENNIRINFSGVNFKDPHRLRYKYRLRGLEENWVEGFNMNEVNYNNLKHGSYTFEVMSRAPNSDWNINPATYSFEIGKPFWMKTWFFGLVGLMFMGSITAYTKLRLSFLEKNKLQSLVEKQTESLQQALSEKEVLIKEIHHRVKNNLAVISGLLEMQSWSVTEGESKSALDESKLRVAAMAKVHESLYQNDDLARIDFAKFLDDLLAGIVSTLNTGAKDIKVETIAESTQMSINTAIPSGLIVNELVTNSFKHAFANRDSGLIRITFKEDDKNQYLSVYDNGVGAGDDVMERKKSSLGISLISSLANQIKATVRFTNGEGSLFEITIPREEN